MWRWWTTCAVVLAGCGTPPAGIDRQGFAARAEWTPESYALAPGAPRAVDGATRLSRGEVTEDVARLEHVLAAAWPDADGELGRAVRARLRATAVAARTPGALCDELARQLLHTSIRVAIAGRPCREPAPAASPEALVEVAAGKHYALRVDGDVAVLGIARFADPGDPGWDGFEVVLRDLASRELVVLDLQRAGGDDPRMGFALLAALGREDVEGLGWQAPAFRDGPYAQVARANLAALGPSARAPRSRRLWASFGDPGAPARLARTLSPVVRDAARPLAMLTVLVGRECESACGLVAAIALRANGPLRPRVELLGAAPPVDADEPGLVRLPASGIEVVFPTASYGPRRLHGPLGVAAARGGAGQALAAVQLIAAQRREARAWEAQPLPACGPGEPRALTDKLGGCPPAELRRGQPTPGVQVVTVVLALDEPRARRFLASCGQADVDTWRRDELHLVTSVDVRAPMATLERLAAAPFVRKLSWHCPDQPP